MLSNSSQELSLLLIFSSFCHLKHHHERLLRAMHHPLYLERFIRFNKHTLNPTTLKSAGHHTSIYAAVKHVGRRSGRAYTTPVVAKPLGDGFVIPLPYEADVDWCRNVLALGLVHCFGMSMSTS